MANKTQPTRANVLIKRGQLPTQRPKPLGKSIVQPDTLTRIQQRAEELGLIIHARGAGKKSGKR